MGAQLWGRQEKAAYQRREDSLYTPSSFPSSLFTTTSPIPLSVSASARTNPAHLKELKLCKHLVEYLRLVPSETHPRSPTGLPTWWKHQDFFFFQAFSPQKKGKKKKRNYKAKGAFLCLALGRRREHVAELLVEKHQTVGRGFANQLVQMAGLRRDILMRGR